MKADWDAINYFQQSSNKTSEKSVKNEWKMGLKSQKGKWHVARSWGHFHHSPPKYE